ncbi:MAG: hypothetical protein WC364_14780 [Eubacteriales bacterium]
MGVSGCVNCCGENHFRDVGAIGMPKAPKRTSGSANISSVTGLEEFKSRLEG